jgi:FecR protein
MKSRYNILNLLSCISMILIVCLWAGSACKKEEAQVRTIATFVIGSVVLERPGDPARQVRHKDELRKDDVIKTGRDSILVIQLGGESLIKIEPDTTVRLSSIIDEGTTKFELAQGTLYNRVKNLKKESSYLVQTKTSLAAVRGTEFSVSSEKDQSTVAVNDGSVKVQGITKKNEVTEEKTVEKGSAADVKDTIATRPITGNEKKEFNKFEKIAAVKDIDNTSESELKKMEAEYFKDEAAAGDKKRDDSSSGKDKPGGGDAEKNTLAWTDKQVYSTSEDIVVNYKNLPENRNCWIDISKVSDPDGRYQSYNWTYSAKDGQMKFSSLGLKPGSYEVRIHFGRSNAVDKRFRFRVQ